MLSAECEESIPYAKDKVSTLVKGKQKSSVRRATSEITLQFKANQRAPRVKESKFDPTFSSFTRDGYQRRLHSEVPQHHHLSDSFDMLTTGTLAGRYSQPADFTTPNSYKHQRYFEKTSDTHHHHHHRDHHSGSRTSTAVSCAEDDSLSLSQNGIHTSSCASGEEVLHESVKFDIDSPKGGFVADFFNENRDLHPSDIPKSSDILSDEHSSSESNRRDTLTAAAASTACAAPNTDTTNVNDVTITDAPAPTKTPFVTSEDQLIAMDLPRCILAGGPAFGWTHESIIICWRRFLGVLGNFYKINNPSTMLDVFQYLNEMTTCLLKIRDYQIVPCVTETCVQPIPPFVPPVELIAPVLFESLNLSEDFVESKQLAIRTLSDIVVRFHDGCPDPELIAQFYYLVHRICVSKEEKYVFEIIRSCSMRIFVSSLPSTHLLILDFLSGVNVVLTNPSPGPEVPRSEAISVILSLLCYPHHFESLESIESTCLEPRIIACNDLKSQLVQLLTQAVLLDPSAEVRCLAITGLSIYCVIEIMNSLGSEHKSSTTTTTLSNTSSSSSTAFDSLFHDSVIILLGMMRFQNRIVAIVAVDMVLMFADYCSIISSRDVKLACLILLSLAWTLFTTWDNTNLDNMTAVDKRFFLGLIQAITEWSMRMPYDQLLINRETKPGSLAPSSNVLGTLIEVFCFIISSNDATSQSLINASQSSTGPLSQIQSNIYFTDPLLEYLATCKTPIDIGLFNSPKTGLDISSLAVKSWLFTGSDNSLSGLNYNENINHITESVRLAARVALNHMLNHLDQFPMSKDGVQINTSIQEHHDQFYPPLTATENDFSSSSSNNNNSNTDVNTDEKELTPDIFEQNNLQIFVLDRSILLTFISLPIMKVVDEKTKKKEKRNSELNTESTDLPVIKDYQLALSDDHSSYIYLPYSSLNSKEDVKMTSLNSTFVTNPFYTRIIARDLSGKYTWDASYLYNSIFEFREQQQLQSNECINDNLLSPIDSGDDLHVHLSREPPPCPPPRMNPPPPLLNGLTSPVLHNLDQLNDVLRDLAATSPECSITWSASKLSEYEHVKEKSDTEIITCLNMEKMTCDQITSQCQMDEDIIHKKLTDADVISLYASPELPNRRESLNRTTSKRNAMQFDNARHLLNQFGYLSWRHRPTVELLQKSPGLVRELKHLDNLGTRETHKLAIFYVGAGQEDKQSILSNQTASLEFENFVAGLGWEIDLLTHKGFRGGLERSGRAGHSTPYFVTSTLEVIFHVSTRMPSSTQEDLKYKHLGNDEIMIIWNENSRAFRRSVLRTQFGDVLIIISPLLNGLYKVEVRREAQVGLFGPIVESAVLSSNVLPGLVRATAINASRAVRAMKPGYHHPYEGRAASLQQIVSKYTLPTSFEEYAESILLPNTKPGYHNQSISPSINSSSINKSSGVKFVSITPNPPSSTTKYESHYNYPHALSAPNFTLDDFNSTNNQRSNNSNNNNKHLHDVRQREHVITVHLNRPPSIRSRTPSVTRIKSALPALSDHNFNSVSPLVNYCHSPAAPLQQSSTPSKVHNNNNNNNF
uniref:Rap-GAP domain-containing protein n=1 Tax=Trichobilharzia regenti TaxID=157069 RepID=A0AA85K3D2_TRIRE|nr:unnamed protein product [Trichobilharzia regenti]